MAVEQEVEQEVEEEVGGVAGRQPAMIVEPGIRIAGLRIHGRRCWCPAAYSAVCSHSGEPTSMSRPLRARR